MARFAPLVICVLLNVAYTYGGHGHGHGGLGGIGGGGIGIGGGIGGGLGGGIGGGLGVGGGGIGGGGIGRGGGGGGGGIGGGVGGGDGGGWGWQPPKEDYYAHPHYKFAYGVNDHHTYDQKTASEWRDGSNVQGSYALREPDGSWRHVTYWADKGGFRANVHRTPNKH